MKIKIFRKTTKLLQGIFTSLRMLFKSVGHYYIFKKDNDGRFLLAWRERNLRLNDMSQSLPFDSHYTYHPAWAARMIAKNKPKKHTDISSIINFAAVLSAFIPVDYFDYRPADIKLSNMASKGADLLNLQFADKSLDSLSCMHTLEHIGLGRYGDPIDPKGDLKAIEELKRVVKAGGDLYIVVPVGKKRIVFNAHRIYSCKDVISYFPEFKLMDFSVVLDDASKGLVSNPPIELVDKQRYACGCFWFRKINK